VSVELSSDVTVELASGISRILFHPTLIADCQARLARGADAVRIGEKMERLCLGFGAPVPARAGGQLEMSVA
jgi:hypothetical protein